MEIQYNGSLFTLITFITAFPLFFFSLVAFIRRDVTGSRVFGWLVLSLAIYGFGISFESVSGNLETALFWARFQYIGVSFSPGLILFFVLRFCDVKLHKKTERLLIGFTVLISVIILAAQFTATQHNLYYQNLRLGGYKNIAAINFEQGPIYHLYSAYLYSVTAVSVILLLFRIQDTSDVYRRQAVAVLTGLLIPVGINLAYVIGLSPGDIDIVPLSFAPMVLIIGYALFFVHMLDLKSVAMETVFELMPTGCVIFDYNLRIIDINNAAYIAFPVLKDVKKGGVPEKLFLNRPVIENMLKMSSSQEVTVVSGEKNRQKLYQLAVKSVGTGKLPGKLLIISDIADKQQQGASDLRIFTDKDLFDGVISRRSFFEIADVVLRENNLNSEWVSFLLIQIDGLTDKYNNENFQAGDQLLKNTVARIVSCLRSSDTLSRFADKQFVALLPGAHRLYAEAAAERIRNSVSELEEVSVKIGISSEYAPDASERDRMLTDAYKSLSRESK